MAKGFNMSSFKSQMRQIQRKVEREINSEVNKATRKFESDVNREIRKYNSQLRRNQQIVSRELNKLKSHSMVRSTYTISLDAMHQHYMAIGNSYDNDYSVWKKVKDGTTPDEIKQFIRDYFEPWYGLKDIYIKKPGFVD